MVGNQKEVIWRSLLCTCRNSWTSELFVLLFLIKVLAKMLWSRQIWRNIDISYCLSAHTGRFSLKRESANKAWSMRVCSKKARYQRCSLQCHDRFMWVAVKWDGQAQLALSWGTPLPSLSSDMQRRAPASPQQGSPCQHQSPPGENVSSRTGLQAAEPGGKLNSSGAISCTGWGKPNRRKHLHQDCSCLVFDMATVVADY